MLVIPSRLSLGRAVFTTPIHTHPKVDKCMAVSGRSGRLESSSRDCSADPVRKVGHSAGWAPFKQSINELNRGRGTFSQENSSTRRLLVSGEARRPVVGAEGHRALPWEAGCRSSGLQVYMGVHLCHQRMDSRTTPG